jgi:hypothetical protein
VGGAWEEPAGGLRDCEKDDGELSWAAGRCVGGPGAYCTGTQAVYPAAAHDNLTAHWQKSAWPDHQWRALGAPTRRRRRQSQMPLSKGKYQNPTYQEGASREMGGLLHRHNGHHEE